MPTPRPELYPTAANPLLAGILAAGCDRMAADLVAAAEEAAKPLRDAYESGMDRTDISVAAPNAESLLTDIQGAKQLADVYRAHARELRARHEG